MKHNEKIDELITHLPLVVPKEQSEKYYQDLMRNQQHNLDSYEEFLLNEQRKPSTFP